MSSLAQPTLLAPKPAEYDPFASFYDRYMAVDFARRAMPVLDRLLSNHLPQGAAVLDLCCGPGRITAALVERGFRATGADASEAMLRLARDNAPAAEFILADMCCFAAEHCYAAVVCTFNSLAHAHTVADLGRVLRNARAALVPGGQLLFDLSMHQQYQRCWRAAFGYAGPEGACVVRPSYDPEQRMARNHITIVPARNHIPRPQVPQTATDNVETASARSEFTIVQRCHSESEVRQALADAGFERIESFDAERDLNMSGESDRRFFLSRRG